MELAAQPGVAKPPMALEGLREGAFVKGLSPSEVVRVVHADRLGNQAVKVTYEDARGGVRNRLVFSDEAAGLELVRKESPWSFDADGSLLRLASEAYRIHLAYLFDPYLAIHTSHIEPLPHQITAVYREMLPRQPLRFLLADDPGAGKTIMAGLLIKELAVRGDVERCLVVAPGGLVEQWQDELSEKLGLCFDILTRDQIESAQSGNPFVEKNHLIARLDVLARNPDLQAKLEAAPEWDLIVCDEAHKMSASFFGSEVKYTKRYQLGQCLGGVGRHLLLMTATPHNGKEEDFQLFLALLDADRFEGRFRDGVHQVEVSDLMRRITKEELLKFDGTPLFPERCAYTVKYDLSEAEESLYSAVTTYVREEMNRAERFSAEGDGKRYNNVGFALQILQRRLASSPAAIHETLQRRRKRREARLAEGNLVAHIKETWLGDDPDLREKMDGYDVDAEDVTDGEAGEIEREVFDQATAALNLDELRAEIEILSRLEAQAAELRHLGTDTKWTQLKSILDDPLMTDEEGSRRKLIVFTEPRDTLDYLADRIRTRLGRPEAVVVIHGGLSREERRKAVDVFRNDKEVLVMVANDAAGEGINLQRSHLMVNYDLPWNPNRLEQRFGRIHRIGQTEVCHCWNLVAAETREGEVFSRLLDKIEVARDALGGRVYNVLGRLFKARELRDLLMEAIRYGEKPDVRARLFEKVDTAVDQENLLDLLADKALVKEAMAPADVLRIREEMDRAEARRLQPFHIQSFFLEAFRHVGGRVQKREAGRWEITRVPGNIIERDRLIGTRTPVQPRYERICFERDKINRMPVATYICPGHPLLMATIDLVLERYRDTMRRGSVLVDETDSGEGIRVLFYLEHAVQDGRVTKDGRQHVISQCLQFLEVDATGHVRDSGPAPYLDYRPLEESERQRVEEELSAPWLKDDLEGTVIDYAVSSVVSRHVSGVRKRRQAEIDKVEGEVTARLKKEINHWDHRAEDLKAKERAGKSTRLSASQAESRANMLEERLRRRMETLGRERDIFALPPRVCGGVAVVPAGLLRRLAPTSEIATGMTEEKEARKIVEQLAMERVLAVERELGNEPRDVSAEHLGYDVESRESDTGRLRFIEVKGRVEGADSVTVTRNEILTALNKPEAFVLAIVPVVAGIAKQPYYVRDPFRREPDFGATSVTYKLRELVARAEVPS